MTRRIYIAGPMRGYPEHNFPAFRAATERFRALGWQVISPVELGEQLFKNDPNVPGGSYLRADVQMLVTCDAIALLPGWERSTGARCEVVVALTIGIPFYHGGACVQIKPPTRVVCNGGYEQAPGAVDTLDQLRDECIAWANRTFTKAVPSSKAEHLRREAVELCADPNDVEEMADIAILLFHLSDGHDLVSAIRAKLEKNKRRSWGKPDADGVVEHVAEGAA